MKVRHQHITHRKVNGEMIQNTTPVQLPEVKNKAGIVIRKAMTYDKPVVKQILHCRQS